ncbi:hypothetical protein ACOMICROBIO_GDFFDHBD_03237 [Vibrio sp. B1REV9]|nr:hypothetical protein ACOMICROBIO_GDFFDHBD_03237 [Vibrio sp. B1REV9]
MTKKYENAVLGDQALIDGLKSINPAWGDMTVRVAGEAWGLPLIDQKTKALISIAIDQMALNVTGEGNPFGAHVDMALKQGATYAKQYKGLTSNDPYQCVLCGNRMVFTGFTAGTKNNELLNNRSMSMRESQR